MAAASILIDPPKAIIFMLADRLGFGDLACYGGPGHQFALRRPVGPPTRSPHGVYANSPLCSPTRAAFVTGPYQHRLG